MSPAPRKPRIKVGVIGLGIIGSRVAANLRGAGHQVYVWSRSPRRAPNFLGSVVEVADLSDVVQVFVSDDTALLEVTRTIAAALSPRHVFASHATVSPAAARQAAAIIEGQGARYLDAPFTGSKLAAQNRQLVYYVGGGKEALEEIRPILEASSKTILHVGGIGDASVLKIATNMVTASTVQTLAEALALVRAAGISGQRLVDALENNGSRSGTSDLKLPAMIAGNFEPNFSLKHMLKDARLALNLADELELSLPVTETAAEVLSLGMENGWADQDFCCVTQLYPAPPASDAGPGAEANAPSTGVEKNPEQSVTEPPGVAVATEVPAATSKANGPRDTASALGSPPRAAEGAIQPKIGQNLSHLKKRTLRALRGLFKAPTHKATSSPAPSSGRPDGLDAILPSDSLVPDPTRAGDTFLPTKVAEASRSDSPAAERPEPPAAPGASPADPVASSEPAADTALTPDR